MMSGSCLNWKGIMGSMCLFLTCTASSTACLCLLTISLATACQLVMKLEEACQSLHICAHEQQHKLISDPVLGLDSLRFCKLTTK